MRRSAMLVAVLTASLSACGGSSTRLATLPQSTFGVQPNVADPTCNHGHGVRLPTRFDGPLVASSPLEDGSTLLAFSSIDPGKRFAVLRSLDDRCGPNPAFGTAGRSIVEVPSGFRAKLTRGAPRTGGLWIDTIVPRKSGGAILSGNFDGQWIVGEVKADGTLDRAFADHGWALFPFPGDVTAVLQEPSGRIIVAGDDGGGGCCTRNWAAALSTQGQLERDFGKHGREELPTGEDSGVTGLALEPSGDVLAKVDYGNMGCWGVALAMLTPEGQPVPNFAGRLATFWRDMNDAAFVGDVLTDGVGFMVIGTGEHSCWDGRHARPPWTHGVVARFRADGRLRSRVVRFQSPLVEMYAFQFGRDTLLVTYPYLDSTRLVVTAWQSSGSVDPSFGETGRARVRAPWTGHDAALTTEVAIGPGGGGTIDIVAWRVDRSGVQLIRLRS